MNVNYIEMTSKRNAIGLLVTFIVFVNETHADDIGINANDIEIAMTYN